MGAGASISNALPDGDAVLEVTLKQLPEAVEESVYVYERFPVVIDPTEQAARFFKYQTGAFINKEDPLQFAKPPLNRALVGSFLHGRTLTLRFPTLEGLDETIFEPKLFPKEIINRSEFFKEEVWTSVLKPNLGDPDPADTPISSEFAFIICTATDYIPEVIKNAMRIIRIKERPADTGAEAEGGNGTDAGMDQIAALYGASETIRNSMELVEAAFDGDLELLQSLIAKGFHLESTDGRKHTALSEASSQGHVTVVEYLLQNGADPNALSDTGRSALWRATFNSHIEVVKLLLEAGANPQFRDKTSLENAFDVAQTDELRALLGEWDMAKTERLMEERRRVILTNLEARIKTSAEREFLARNLLRKELVEKAESGDIEGIKQLLTMVAEEAVKSGCKPRASAEVRNEQGQSLLSIAAQHDNVDLAEFLLTYWKSLDADRWDLVEGETSVEAKVFKANPNSRDLKGWTCLCIAVFHDARKVLRLLLEHGGDPNIRSSYNRNAWDLAKVHKACVCAARLTTVGVGDQDELDAAEKVVKSHAEIRDILLEYETTHGGNRLFTNAEIVKGPNATGDMYEGLEKDGSPVVMNIEMNKEMQGGKDDAGKGKKPKAKSGGGGPKAGGGGKAKKK